MSGQPTVFFLSSTHKGDVMIEQARDLGCRVILMTEESQRQEAWPYHLIDEFFITPDFRRYQDVINTVTYLARGRRIDLLLPLDEFEVELAAILREHMRLPGMGVSLMRHFRDKLTMRQLAQAAGIRVPAFTRILNYDELRAFFDAVPPPYMLKPRMEAGSMGIRKVYDSEQVWRALDELGDRQSYYLLEQFLPGSVYHVDSVVYQGKVVYSSVQGYLRPPIDVYQGGGVFATRVLPRTHPDVKAMTKLNAKVIKALGLTHGAAHAEFIKAEADGQLYFLEIAARVGGAYISDMLEHATGVNPWREWMKIEYALLNGTDYIPPASRPGFGAVLVTLARVERPDLSAYTDPEIAYRVDKPYHAGVVLASDDCARVEALLNEYLLRFSRDFMTSVAPMDAQRTGLSG
jgi:biotin carboxylase